jgi:hypothetical protein
MNRNALHPLALADAFPTSPAAHRATLEAQVEQWFAPHSAGNEEVFGTLQPSARRDGHGPRKEAVEEAISWSIVPNMDRKIPGSGQ